MADETRDINELDFSAVDFEAAEWSWNYNAEKQEGALLHTTHGDDGFSTITYPLPKCMVFIIDRIRGVALAELKRELRALDAQREKLLN
ncbi:hypothetical protein [Rheinheimera sp.]|uniref:hypothetical protein n=1 Tax=Rheinheimera sp. TaxID=1869214 RepID=UPI0040477833